MSLIFLAVLLLLITTPSQHSGFAAAAFLGPPSGIPVAWGQETRLGFGIPSFGSIGPKNDDNKDESAESAKKPEKKITAGGLIQLITAGMGAPFLGDFEGVDEVSIICSCRGKVVVRNFGIDFWMLTLLPVVSDVMNTVTNYGKLRLVIFSQLVQETGKFMFSLEANNLVDEYGNSKQTQMPYFENGWVEEKDETEANNGGGFKFPWQK